MPLNTNTKPRSGVRFHSGVEVVEILNFRDYTQFEIAAGWYSTEQMEQITKRCVKVIKSIDAGRGRKYCTRGLEGHSRLGSISKKKNKFTAIAAVLTEQSQQWIEDIVDEQAIAEVYKRTTSSCQMWARVKGNQDRQTADAVLFKEEEEDEEEKCTKAEVPKSFLSRPQKSEEHSFLGPFSSSNSTSRRRSSKVEVISPQSSRTARLVVVSWRAK